MDDCISKASSNLSNSVCVSRFLYKVAGNISKARTPGRLWAQVARDWSFNLSFPCTRMLFWRTWYPSLFPLLWSGRQGNWDSPHSSPPSTPIRHPLSEGSWRWAGESPKAASKSQGAAVYSSSCVCSPWCWLAIRRIIKAGAIICLDPKVFCVIQCLSGHVSCVLCGHSATSFRCSVLWLAPVHVKQTAEERSILILIRSTPFWKMVQMKELPGKL